MRLCHAERTETGTPRWPTPRNARPPLWHRVRAAHASRAKRHGVCRRRSTSGSCTACSCRPAPSGMAAAPRPAHLPHPSHVIPERTTRLLELLHLLPFRDLEVRLMLLFFQEPPSDRRFSAGNGTARGYTWRQEHSIGQKRCVSRNEDSCPGHGCQKGRKGRLCSASDNHLTPCSPESTRQGLPNTGG